MNARPPTFRRYVPRKGRMNGVAAGACGHVSSRGFALITALLMLVVLTLLGVSMMGGISLQEKMASNTREKTRAFDAAQAALLDAQLQLSSLSSPPTASSCTGTTATTLFQVCNAALNNPTSVPWSHGVYYKPSGMTVSNSGGADTYASSPQYYIQDLGGTHPHLYLITAQATGGNANTVVVVQSLYALNGSSGGSTPATSVGGS